MAGQGTEIIRGEESRFSEWREVLCDHTQTPPTRHKADALPSPSGRRNRIKGEGTVKPGSVPEPTVCLEY